MRKDIVISGITCHFKSSAAVPKIYRMLFQRDVFKDMSKLSEEIDESEQIEKQKKEKAEKEGYKYVKSSSLPVSSLEMFENIAYVMHKHGDPSQPNDIVEWLDQFETFDIYETLPEIIDMWQKETHQESVPKKV